MENLVESLMRLLLHIMVNKCLHGYLLSLFYHYYTMFTLYEESVFLLLFHHNFFDKSKKIKIIIITYM